jgi:3-dehydroquinate synthase
MSPEAPVMARDAAMATGPLMVQLGERRYPIHVEAGLLERAGELLAPLLPRPLVLLVTDTNVALTPHLARLETSLGGAGIAVRRLVVVPGEGSKSLESYARLVEAMLATGIDRKTTVVAMGGGVVGDLAGFAAATALRGLPFVQVPTTLLAQVDSSVGGKTGINSAHGKNLIGAFHQPVAVLIDVDVLDDLPERELKAGYAEVIKHACLADAAYFDWLEAHAPAMLAGDPALRMAAIRWSVSIKAAVVAEDERETTGRRALLNFGHTFAHAYEALTGYGDRLLHGEAVALGMVKAARLSAATGHASAAAADRLEAHLQALDIATDPRRLLNRGFAVEAVIDAMTRDKKAEAGALRFVLWRGVGDAFLTGGVDPGVLREVLAADA